MSLSLASLPACTAGGRPAAPVLQVDLPGVRQVDADELTSGLANHPPDGWLVRKYSSFDPLQLTIDRQRILSFYQARGFYSARLEDVEVRLLRDGYGITFTVREGPPYTVRQVILQGAPDATIEARLKRQVPLKPKDVFVYQTYETAKSRLTAQLVQSGYAHASVSGAVEVFRRDAQVVVTFKVDAGPLVRFGDVRIDPGPLPEAAVRARLAFKPGDVYDPARLSLTEARLYELGLVGLVTFYLPNDRTPIMNVGLRIQPGPRNELRLGGGVARQSPNYQVRFRTGYVRRDIFHPLVRVSTEVRPAVVYRPVQRRLAYGVEWSADVTREDLFVPRLVGQARVQYSLLQYEAYATLGTAFRLLVDRPWLDDRLHWSMGAHLKLLGFPRIDPVVPLDRFGSIGLPPCEAPCAEGATPSGLSLLYLEPALTFDGRDDPVDPTRGFYGRLHFELGHVVSRPRLPWIRLTPEVRAYTAIGRRRFVLAGRARLGAKILPGRPLPATQRYFGGGSESQRGFSIRQLSPFFGTGKDAVPVGGEAMFELSGEARLHLFRVFGMWLGIVGFVDAADVRDDFSDLEWLRPHVAAGGGLRLFTPIGPVRFDVGYRLNRVAPGIEPGGSDRLALHLSLGEAF